MFSQPGDIGRVDARPLRPLTLTAGAAGTDRPVNSRRS